VWEPMLATDWASPTSSTLARISDPRAIQFWDKEHLFGRELRHDLLANPSAPRPNCCDRSGIYWDMAVLYPKQATWANSLPSPAFVDGPVVSIQASLREKLTAMLTSP